MGLVERFERRLEGIVGDAAARVFGGQVVPKEVEQALQREAGDNLRELPGGLLSSGARARGRLLAPAQYIVTLGPTDHQELAKNEQAITRQLASNVRTHLARQGWETYGDVVVSLQRSEALHTGQFRISSSVDASEQKASPHRTAGDRPMSQAPGHYPEGDQRGQYGYDQGQYGQGYDQNYGQQQQQQGYDPNYGQQQQQGYDPNYGQGQYGGQQQGQYGQQQGYYDPNYGGQQQGYYDPNYGGQGGYGQGGYQQSPPGYDQYGQGQYGGQQGYDQGGYGQGYPADPNAQGYAPPAVQGQRQLTGTLMLDDGSNRSYALTQGSNVVGRGQDAQFRLPDTGVSRRHLEISWDGHAAMLSDLGSTNGTTVNGQPVQNWQLGDGDVIRIGHSSLIFRTHS